MFMVRCCFGGEGRTVVGDRSEEDARGRGFELKGGDVFARLAVCR